MKSSLFVLALLIAGTAFGQQAPLQYGHNITLAEAKKVAAASEAYAISKNWAVVIAIVDANSNLVYLQKQDGTQIGSLQVAQAKARTANDFKRPTKAFQDGVTSGGENLRILSLPNAIAVEGGELIISDGKIIGAIGISGLSAAQDTEVAKAGTAVIK
ncbi:MAG TPA: heme-binding protein [Cyclobacteriaceae bacterium]|nr:heme-binding protein [Cyclobacteriaceae bacterium]